MLDPHHPDQGAVTVAETGRYVVIFDEPHPARRPGPSAAALQDEAPAELGAAGYAADEYYPRLGVGVIGGPSEQLAELRRSCAARRLPVQVVPELVYSIRGGTGRGDGTDPTSPAAANRTGAAEATGEPPDSGGAEATGQPPFVDTDTATWGLQAVGAVGNDYTGAGVRVAVLDTGFDVTHPDFADRDITTASFVAGEDVTDGHGHGTHCVGISCGPRHPWGPATGRGYGVAPQASIYAGKVLGDDGSGSDSQILAGIDWALSHDVDVISMSLGADVREVHPPYVAAGRRALELGSLIVAAAGNNAHRSRSDPGFVGSPANSPHVMAVGALDSRLRVADFSARTLSARGGQVDLAAPGVDVYSSWPMPQRYRTISGTSMATPHVAGVAALLAEATGSRGRALWAQLDQAARRLDRPSVDVGDGLVQAPPANGG